MCAERARNSVAGILIAALLLALSACRNVTPRDDIGGMSPRQHAEERAARQDEAEKQPVPEDERRPTGEIVACGQRFAVYAPVVRWNDDGGYSAYRTALHFADSPRKGAPAGLRYRPGREGLGVQPTLRQLRGTVDLFVLHYDAAGTSSNCFRVLHDRRGLSVHFLLDVDGTIYQTLDLADTGWHAASANRRSVGIEIANVGAWPQDQAQVLERWYRREPGGTRLEVPPELEPSGVRTAGFVAEPARPEPVRGVVQGRELVQYDMTPEQYASLGALAAALRRALPRIDLEAPRDAAGHVRREVLSEEELEAFSGIVGHLHVSRAKVDPGPAFDWERFLRGATIHAARWPAAPRSLTP